ncbi:MotA/TolQ/ExbB proton channel family protein [Roseococcus sp. SDR]|uniref:MotA/TolQ/ExbB proton channel family protein n=1 Tax=Roseococcus sp. SDR TaxID=2835532 RepID=UPI001BCBAC0F|nr:MotA/TolQ/ExbB proton channel family protein [Roseococcus sp. SDR]MBS7792346.1 MotA/TolQ/ExbB proton channel family protein [Roseococcus sp. SDR]MBV1847660.1 MotA/TolQ/ExbB proton channel family protein [Roseococcus sp. SDR]
MDPTPTLALPAASAHDLSPWALFLMADPIVKGVMLLLVVASVICWAIIFEKWGTLRRLGRESRALARMAADERPPTAPPDQPGLPAAALRAGLPEWRQGQGARETDGEYRARLDAAMRKAVAREVKRAEPGLSFLATTGSVAPFIGLFGTVWGIMRSFVGIAASNDTSLAVVAPGIAEALFATAIGLVAAIPAVIAYNRILAALGALRGEALSAASDLAARLARASALTEARGPRQVAD